MAFDIPNYKVILCGEYGVGKTTLFFRFKENRFMSEEDSDIGHDYASRTYTVNGKKVTIELWDTGGMEKVGSITQAYFRNAHGAILCYNPANKESFNMLSDYILQVAMFSRNAKIFLCGTMADRRPMSMVGFGEEYVREEEIEEFERFCSTALSGVFKVSSRTGEGLNEMFRTIAEQIHRDRNIQTLVQQMEKRNSVYLGQQPSLPPGKKSCCQ